MKPGELKQIQARLGYTNAELAERMHVSVSLIEKYRLGSVPIRKPFAELLKRISNEHKNTRTDEARRIKNDTAAD